MRKTYFLIAAAVLIGWCLFANAENAPDRLIVHEWGTFTELQNEQGISVGGINTDDEPVPDFVHRISPNLLQPTSEPWRRSRRQRGKALQWNADITTRLETPVIYFYPPKDLREPMRLDVDVKLRGGWLSEFYPRAEFSAPGLKQATIDPKAVGTLRWANLRVDVDASVPESDEHVWLAPRKTDGATVATPDGEAENYLFYRGVGNFTGPVRVETVSPDQLRIHSHFHTLNQREPLTIPAAWLVSVQADGNVAYRSLGAMDASPGGANVLAETSRRFDRQDYSKENLNHLTAEMHHSLVEDGLYANEATAMLSTWERAYFQSPGLRLFYLLPQQWTDDRMPLTISTDADVDRVMVGRIELITDKHRELLEQIASHEPASRDWFKHIPASEARDRFFAGDNEAAKALGVKLPPEYEAYLGLGRFRNALIHNELMHRRIPHLAQFAKVNGILSRDALRVQQSEAAKVAESKAAARNHVPAKQGG